MELLVLKAAIFPDRDTVEQALARLPDGWTQSIFDVSQPQGAGHDWDGILDRLLVADRIIVV